MHLHKTLPPLLPRYHGSFFMCESIYDHVEEGRVGRRRRAACGGEEEEEMKLRRYQPNYPAYKIIVCLLFFFSFFFNARHLREFISTAARFIR